MAADPDGGGLTVHGRDFSRQGKHLAERADVVLLWLLTGDSPGHRAFIAKSLLGHYFA